MPSRCRLPALTIRNWWNWWIELKNILFDYGKSLGNNNDVQDWAGGIGI